MTAVTETPRERGGEGVYAALAYGIESAHSITLHRAMCGSQVPSRGDAADTSFMVPPRLTVLAFALLCAFAGGVAANPTGGAVVTGKADVSTSGKTLTVTNAPGTIIHWQGFSIAPDELTRFIQQSATSAVLNRVVGQDPSSLLGRLQSNGRVFLINPNGIVFGAGARIDVGGLVASTLDLGDTDFLAGRLRFAGPASAGPLTQLGQINTAAGGQVLLIGPRVENAGVIISPQGEILLAAGTSVQLADTANPALRVTVSAPAGEALNLGKLIAEGGRIGIHAGLIGQSGTLSAERAELGPGGQIYLKASSGVTLAPTSRISAGGTAGGQVMIDAGNATLHAAGVIEASGASAGGGSVRLLGHDIHLADATVDASGASSGGAILVGGDYQGANPALANARTTEVSAGTSLAADARERGQGGKVIVWADEATRFGGRISARGGAQGGDGGMVEVSGKQTLAFDGTVDTRAPLGATGTLLLDPSDITISIGANAAVSAGPTFTGTATSSTLNTTTLQTALATSNVIVDTTSASASAGNIAVNNAVTWASGNSLDLRAHNNITVAPGATINAIGNGALHLIANQDGIGGGDVAINAALTAHAGGISVSGVGITSAAAGTLTTTGLVGANAGAVSLTATGAVSLAGAIAANGGAGPSPGSGPGGAGGAVSVSGTTVTTVAITASGGAASGANQAGANAGTVSVVGSGAISTGAITASTGAATGTGAAGAAGGVTLQGTTVTAAALTTTGGANGPGGAIGVTATTGLLNLTGALDSSGGLANASSAGRNAGNVTLSGVNVTTLGIAANGSAGATLLSNQPGGAGGAVSITSTGGVSTAAIGASGGAAQTTNAAGGNAGSIVIANSGAGNVVTTTLTASTGTAAGTGAGGAGGAGISLSNTAGNVQTTALTTTGGAGSNGGAVTATASGSINVGTVTTSGGAANANSAGPGAGAVTLSGASVTTLGISANGANGNGNDFAGGNGANVSVTGTGGTVSVGTISTAAGNGVAGNAAGGNAGAITLDAGGVTPTITSTGSLTATGGNRIGTGTAGTGGQIWFKDAALIGAGPLTFAAGGGSAGVGTGGNVRFDGTVDSSGGARALTLNTNGSTIFNGALGAGSALLSLTTDATGTTQLNSGTVTTTGAQAFGDAVTLGATTTLDAGAGAITFGSTVNGAFALTANSSVVTTFSGAVGAVTPLASLTTNAGGSTTIGGGAITTSGSQTYNDAVNYGAGTVLTATAGTVVSGGVFRAIAPAGSLTFTVDATKDISLVNPANDFATVTVTSARNVTLRDTNAIALGTSTISGTLDVTAGGTITQTGALAVSGAASFSTGAAAITLNNAGNDFMSTVSAINTGGNVAITDVNDLQLGTIGMASAVNTLTVVSSGAITQAGASTVTTGTGAVSFNSGAGGSPITLTNDNDFRGAVSLTNAGANDVAIKDVNALTFGAGAVARNLQANSAGTMAFNGVLSVAGNLQAGSGGNPMTEGAAAALTVTGTTLLTAGAAGNITLNTAGNNFGGEVRVVSGNTVNLRDANTIAFGNGGTSTISGNLTVTSAGAISQTQPLNVAGTATFAPGVGNNVTLLDAANDFGGIAFTSGNTATMRDVNGVVFGTTNVTALDINAGGTVTQSGVVSATTLTADLTGATSALNFNTSSNGISNLAVSGGKGITAPGGFRLTNSVGITGQGIVTTTNAPIYVSANGLFQNAGTSAFVAGSGDITVISSLLAINSTAAPGSFQTSGTLLMRPITAAADMSFAGAGAAYNLIPVEVARVVGGVTGTVTFGEQGFSNGILTIAGALPFGNITANLNAGSITDGGTVRTVTARNLNMNAATGTIGTAVANGAIDVAVTNLTLNTVNQNASVTSASGYNLGFGAIESNVGTGTLSTNLSAGGSITQTTKVTAGTLTALLAGASGAVNLDTVDNNISNIGAVTAPQGFRLTNGNNPTTVTASVATNGPVSISTGTGAFSQNNVDISAGSSPITITADSISIAANTGSNAMQTTGTLTLKPSSAGTNMSLAGASAFDLSAAEITDIAGGVGAAGSIVIGDAAASTGAMTLGGAANFGVKTVTLNAGSFTDGNTVSPISARDLNLNARTGAIGATGGTNAIDVNATNLRFSTNNQAAFVTASGAVNLGSGTSATGTGSLDLTAGGAITQSAGGTITASGATTLAAGAANDITLNAANDFGTVVITSGRNVTLNDTNALNLGASTISGNLQVTTAGALTQSGAIVANGAGKTATFAAGAGNDIMLAGANDFTSVSVNSARNATLNDNNALALGASTVNGAFVATAGGDVTLNGVINASGVGDAIVLAAAGNFINNAGASALVPGSGRWLVYSTDPAADTRGGLVYGFKQYNATPGVTPVLGTGNGMLYSLAPALAVSLTGTVGKVYDGTTVATLGPANYSFSGTIDGDTASLNNPAVGTYATKNVGSGIDASVAGVAVTSAANAGRPVYGYQPASSTINATIGNITAAALTVTAQPDSRGYDSTRVSAVAPLVTGTLYDPVGTAAIQAFDTKNVGAGKTLTANGLVVNDGNGGNNYAISYVAHNTGVITPAGLTVTGVVANSKVYDATATATLTTGGAVLGGAFAGDTVTLNTGAASATFGDKNAGVAKPVTAIGFTTGGPDAANYTLAQPAGLAADITPRAITITASSNSRVYDGTTTSAAAPTASGLVGGDTVTSLSQAFDSRNAGTRTLTVNGGYSVNDGNGGANYSVTTNTAAGSITPAALALGAVADTKVYDGTVGSTGVPLVVSGLVAGDSVSALTQTFDSRNAGARSIGVSGYAVSDGNGGANYTVSTNAAAGSITPAALTISADDKSRTTTQPNPPLTATYAGFVAAETVAVLSGGLTLTTAADALSAPGLYAIVPAGQSSQNYTIRYVNGTLSVLLAPAPPTTTAPGLDSALATRDARLVDLSAAQGAGSRSECRPPPAADERVCVGWPVCQVPRPVCGSRVAAEPGR